MGRLGSVLVLHKVNIEERLFFMFFSFSISRMYFCCKIETIWVILVLLLSLGKIFLSHFWNSYRRWDDKCRFSRIAGLGVVLGPLSYKLSLFMKNSVADSDVASNWTWAARAQRASPSSWRVSTPLCIFVRRHLKCSWQISKACTRPCPSSTSLGNWPLYPCRELISPLTWWCSFTNGDHLTLPTVTS